jgi:general secretion pathway protein K
MKTFDKGPQAGVVLIAVLWGVMLLTAIAFALAAATRVSVDELENRKESMQAYYVARGAALRTAVILSTNPAPATTPAIVPGQQTLEWNEGSDRVTVELSDEGGKIDVNSASEQTLERLLMVLGVDLQSAPALVREIENWRRPSSIAGVYGADDSYYLSLPEPYHPAHADFRSVEELLLVRGVTEGLFYGRYVVRDDGQVERHPGLLDCLTVRSASQSININYAPYPVLMAMPQMDAAVANSIVAGRAKRPFTSVSDVTREFPASLGAETLSFLTTQNSGWFTLTSRGSSPRNISARVRVLVKLQNGQGAPFRIAAWDDDYVQ